MMANGEQKKACAAARAFFQPEQLSRQKVRRFCVWFNVPDHRMPRHGRKNQRYAAGDE